MRLCTMLQKTVFGLLGVRRQGSGCAAGPDGSGGPDRPNRGSERLRLECRQPVHLSRGGRGQELPDGPKTPNPMEGAGIMRILVQLGAHSLTVNAGLRLPTRARVPRCGRTGTAACGGMAKRQPSPGRPVRDARLRGRGRGSGDGCATTASKEAQADRELWWTPLPPLVPELTLTDSRRDRSKPCMQASRCCGQHHLDGCITNAAVAGIVF